MSQILVTGSIALDRIAVFHDRFANHILPEKVHRLNVAFTVDNMTVNFGGTGGNIAYNLALLGAKPMLMGTVGTDAAKYLQHLKKHKVDCRYVKKIPKVLTAHATVMTDMDDNQITAFYMGAMSFAHKFSILNFKFSNKSQISNLKSQIESEIQNPKSEINLAIIAPNDIKAMVKHADECRRSKVRFIADPGQAIPALSKIDLQDLITGAYVLVVNDYEWDLIREKTGWEMKDVLSKINYLIITYGENGSKVWRKDATMWEVPVVKPKEIIDPTGCGDAFRAGLMYGIIHDYPIEKSAAIGAWIAAKAIEKAGTQNHKVKKSDFQKFLKKI